MPSPSVSTRFTTTAISSQRARKVVTGAECMAIERGLQRHGSIHLVEDSRPLRFIDRIWDETVNRKGASPRVAKDSLSWTTKYIETTGQSPPSQRCGRRSTDVAVGRLAGNTRHRQGASNMKLTRFRLFPLVAAVVLGP